MISSILFIIEVQNSVVNVELASCVKYAYLQIKKKEIFHQYLWYGI